MTSLIQFIHSVDTKEGRPAHLPGADVAYDESSIQQCSIVWSILCSHLAGDMSKTIYTAVSEKSGLGLGEHRTFTSWYISLLLLSWKSM